MKKLESYEQQGVAITCRSFGEYTRMFSLDEKLLHNEVILDIAAGASSFSAEAIVRGNQSYAVDPRFELPPEELQTVVEEEIRVSTQKLDRLKDQFDWSYYGSVEQHQASRVNSSKMFCEHYESDWNKPERVYVHARLPLLPFEDNKFSLILCSHFLFLYESQLDLSFHQASLLEMIRVCRPGGEIRIYPLLTLNFVNYPLLDELINQIISEHIEITYLPSKLPFIPSSSLVLCIRKNDFSHKLSD